jgi:hypothetical protein
MKNATQFLHSFSKTRLEFLVKEKVPESGDQSSPELGMPSKSEDDPNTEEQNSKQSHTGASLTHFL